MTGCYLQCCNTYHSYNKKVCEFQFGDKEWIRNYGKGDKWIQGIILVKTGSVLCKISHNRGEEKKHRSVKKKIRKNRISWHTTSKHRKCYGGNTNQNVNPMPHQVQPLTLTLKPTPASNTRPKRNTQLPSYLKDYHLYIHVEHDQIGEIVLWCFMMPYDWSWITKKAFSVGNKKATNKAKTQLIMIHNFLDSSRPYGRLFLGL